MGRKADVKGGNADVIFDKDNCTAKKYLRNTSSKEKIVRFKRELEVLNKLSKCDFDNIVEVTNVYINNESIGESYIEMKKYDGSLYDLFGITRGNVDFSLNLILPIIKALHKLSKYNPPIYHRDIKPDNILYLKKNNDYMLFLSDFGACFLNDGSERITPDNVAVGPRMFIAPEYELGKVEEIDEKGDIFSIGKVIWCMINGVVDDYLPSNYWFIDEYNLQRRFPLNPDMIKANIIISSCLSINPTERCNYGHLIDLIGTNLKSYNDGIFNETKLKVKLYQEKRKIELIEIKEKNKLLVNSFSQYYLKALNYLIKEYDDFELIKVLFEEYKLKSRDGINFTTVNVENNSAHYLYSRTYDRMYISINYNPAHGNERYCHISLSYNISSGKSDNIIVSYNDNGKMICVHNKENSILNEKTLTSILNNMILDYVS